MKKNRNLEYCVKKWKEPKKTAPTVKPANGKYTSYIVNGIEYFIPSDGICDLTIEYTLKK
jgi:hypothetical protein